MNRIFPPLPTNRTDDDPRGTCQQCGGATFYETVRILGYSVRDLREGPPRFQGHLLEFGFCSKKCLDAFKVSASDSDMFEIEHPGNRRWVLCWGCVPVPEGAEHEIDRGERYHTTRREGDRLELIGVDGRVYGSMPHPPIRARMRGVVCGLCKNTRILNPAPAFWYSDPAQPEWRAHWVQHVGPWGFDGKIIVTAFERTTAIAAFEIKDLEGRWIQLRGPTSHLIRESLDEPILRIPERIIAWQRVFANPIEVNAWWREAGTLSDERAASTAWRRARNLALSG